MPPVAMAQCRRPAQRHGRTLVPGQARSARLDSVATSSTAPRSGFCTPVGRSAAVPAGRVKGVLGTTATAAMASVQCPPSAGGAVQRLFGALSLLALPQHGGGKPRLPGARSSGPRSGLCLVWRGGLEDPAARCFYWLDGRGTPSPL